MIWRVFIQLLIMVGACNYSFTQAPWKIVENLTDSLKKQGVDTLLIYHSSSFCNPPHNEDFGDYVFWKQQGQYFVARTGFTDHMLMSISKEVKTDSINPISFFIQNRCEISSEELFSPVFYTTDVTTGDRVRLIERSSIHACTHDFKFRINDSLENYYIDIDKFSPSHYVDTLLVQKNINTLTKRLLDLTEKLVHDLKDENRFIIKEYIRLQYPGE